MCIVCKLNTIFFLYIFLFVRFFPILFFFTFLCCCCYYFCIACGTTNIYFLYICMFTSAMDRQYQFEIFVSYSSFATILVSIKSVLPYITMVLQISLNLVLSCSHLFLLWNALFLFFPRLLLLLSSFKLSPSMFTSLAMETQKKIKGTFFVRVCVWMKCYLYNLLFTHRIHFSSLLFYLHLLLLAETIAKPNRWAVSYFIFSISLNITNWKWQIISGTVTFKWQCDISKSEICDN